MKNHHEDFTPANLESAFEVSDQLPSDMLDLIRRLDGVKGENPLFDPQPEYCANLHKPILTPRTVAAIWSEGDDDDRAAIDQMLEAQHREIEADHKRMHEEWMK